VTFFFPTISSYQRGLLFLGMKSVLSDAEVETAASHAPSGIVGAVVALLVAYLDPDQTFKVIVVEAIKKFALRTVWKSNSVRTTNCHG